MRLHFYWTANTWSLTCPLLQLLLRTLRLRAFLALRLCSIVYAWGTRVLRLETAYIPFYLPQLVYKKMVKCDLSDRVSVQLTQKKWPLELAWGQFESVHVELENVTWFERAILQYFGPGLECVKQEHPLGKERVEGCAELAVSKEPEIEDSKIKKSNGLK